MAKPTVAILGASSTRSKFGNISVRAHQRAGYDVYPVNPNEKEIEELACYPTLADVPVKLDRVSVYLRPEITMGLVDELAQVKPTEVWLNPGAESAELVQCLQKKGLNVVTACSIVALGLSPSNF
jgi:predicted CoA-binding protein